LGSGNPSHAGVVGQFIIGGVYYAVFYNEDPRLNTYKPEGMSDEDAAFYRGIINEVTQGRRLPPPSDKGKLPPKKKPDFSKEEGALQALKDAAKQKN